MIFPDLVEKIYIFVPDLSSRTQVRGDTFDKNMAYLMNVGNTLITTKKKINSGKKKQFDFV